jgi:hypothetical protein
MLMFLVPAAGVDVVFASCVRFSSAATILVGLGFDLHADLGRRIRRAREREKGLRERLEGDDISHLLAAQRAQAESIRCDMSGCRDFSWAWR